MLDAARDARSFLGDADPKDVESNRMLALSIVKCIEIIGEAAAHVTPPTREKHPHIPWQDIIGMRNRLIHAYFDVDVERVWDTVTDDLPPLIAELEKIIPKDRSS